MTKIDYLLHTLKSKQKINTREVSFGFTIHTSQYKTIEEYEDHWGYKFSEMNVALKKHLSSLRIKSNYNSIDCERRLRIESSTECSIIEIDGLLYGATYSIKDDTETFTFATTLVLEFMSAPNPARSVATDGQSEKIS